MQQWIFLKVIVGFMSVGLVCYLLVMEDFVKIIEFNTREIFRTRHF